MENDGSPQSEQILGIRFFNGTAKEAVARMAENGGLLVAPSGTCFERFLQDEEYRRAIVAADVVLPDSGLMVVLWRLLRGRSINRISGLAYVKELSGLNNIRGNNPTIWVLPYAKAREKLLAWGSKRSIPIDPADCYIAPIYSPTVNDESLLALIDSRQPKHVVIAIGAGAQEKLGLYLREHLACRPAIHCIGGALGFVTGDQVAIPDWADRLYLGWFLRLSSQPRVMLPRLWKGRVLPWLMLRYGDKLPPGRY